MSDEVERLRELAADLVSERRFEPALMRLFQRPPGDWLRLEEMCGTSEAANAVVTWLPGPEETDTFAIVLVYDPESFGSFTALYNAARLRRVADGTATRVG